MIKIKIDEKQLNELLRLRKTDSFYKVGIRQGYVVLSTYLKRDVQDSFRSPKTGRFYFVKKKGRWTHHRASAPGEAPAIISGALSRSVETKRSGYYRMTFSAGSGITYASYLEYGINRPYMTPSVKKNRGNAMVIFRREINRALRGHL